MAMSAARMVKDGVIIVSGTELGRAILIPVPSADSGIGESDPVNAFFRL